VNRRVDLAIAAAVESMAVGVAGADGNRGDAGGASELCVGAKASGASDLADERGCSRGAEPRLAKQLGRDPGDQVGDFRFERVMVWVSSRMRGSSSRAMRTRIVCSARASRRAMRGPHMP
jgi:hypothetical protein